MQVDGIPSVEKEIRHAERWLLDWPNRSDEAPTIVRTQLMIIRFLLKDLRELQEMHRLEDGWSEK